MQKLFKIKAILAAASLCFISGLAVANPVTGLVNEKLTPCPSKPNCIVTEYKEPTNRYMAPLLLSEIDVQYSDSMTAIKSVVKKMGGDIIVEDSNYLHAQFTTFLFSFVDDFEVRVDQERRLVHLRSASRSGYYDFGKNKRRINKFTLLLTGATEY